MQIEKFYKAQDLRRQITVIETVINSEVVDESALDKLDIQLRNKTKAEMSAFAKENLRKLKNDLEEEFNSL